MKKRDYEKPSMKVVKMRQRQHLMNGSVQSMRSGYGEAQEEDWK